MQKTSYLIKQTDRNYFSYQSKFNVSVSLQNHFNGSIVKSSNGGISFESVTTPSSTDIKGITFGNNTFILVQESGGIMKLTDNGTTWVSVTSPTSKDLHSVEFGNNTFVAVGED